MKQYRMIAEERGYKKDTVRNTARKLGITPQVIDGTHYVNEKQEAEIVHAIENPKRKSRKNEVVNNTLLPDSVNTHVNNQLITAVTVLVEAMNKNNELLSEVLNKQPMLPEPEQTPTSEKVGYWRRLGRALIGK